MLKKAGHNVDCLNLNHYAGPVENLINNSLSEKKYDYALTGGLSTSYNQIKMVTDAVRKSASDVKLILGGGAISSEPELMFNVLNPDFIVIGEGEKAIVELLSCLENNGDLGGVLGIGYRDKSGKVICNQPQPAIMELDSLPWPDFEGFEFEQYLENMRPSDQYFYDLFDHPRVYPIICSRSCPFLCTFCFHPIGNKYRQRSVNSIMQELSVMVIRYRINIIAIYDELFSNNREWLYDFCRRFREFSAELSWECRWGCQMRVDKLDDEMLKIMKDAGCYMVSYGFESYSPVILKSMKKHITPGQISKAIELTLKNKISIQGNFIFGDPAETAETARETLSFWKSKIEAGIMLVFVSPYPGTEIYKRCITRGIIKNKLDFIENHISDVINMTDKMNPREFSRLQYDIHEAELRYQIYATPEKIKSYQNGTHDITIRCPHCKKVMEYRNFFLSQEVYFFRLAYCRNCRLRFFMVSILYYMLRKIILLFYPILPYLARKALYKMTLYFFKLKPFIRSFLLERLVRAKFS